MTEVSFYHLTRTPLEQALPQLLEKILAKGSKAIVLLKDEGQVKEVDKALWTYKAESFLPHGTNQSGNAQRQPVYVTCEVENLNGADFIVSVGGAGDYSFITSFDRCLDIFNGHDATEVSAARERWKNYKSKEKLDLTYWKQDDKGRWEKAG